jgi:hypothetical protein
MTKVPDTFVSSRRAATEFSHPASTMSGTAVECLWRNQRKRAKANVLSRLSRQRCAFRSSDLRSCGASTRPAAACRKAWLTRFARTCPSPAAGFSLHAPSGFRPSGHERHISPVLAFAFAFVFVLTSLKCKSKDNNKSKNRECLAGEWADAGRLGSRRAVLRISRLANANPEALPPTCLSGAGENLGVLCGLAIDDSRRSRLP